MIGRLCSSVADLLFPPVCLACRTTIPEDTSGPLCADCRRRLCVPRRPLCRCCPRPVPRFGELCRICRRIKPSFTQARSALLYTPVIQKLLHRYKYGRCYGLRSFFADILAAGLPTTGWDLRTIEAVTPIPQHWCRTWLRGFDAVSAFTAPFCTKISRSMVPCLKRVRWTPFQARSDPDRRWTNLRNAFTIKHPGRPRYAGRTWLVVDDVFTTGATAHEAAAALKKAGVQTVYVFTVCAAEQSGLKNP